MKRLWILFPLFFLLAGCALNANEAETDSGLRFYYIRTENAPGSALDFETIYDETITIADAMNLLLSGEFLPEGYPLTFPSGTELLDWSMDDHVLALNLSEEFGRMNNIRLTEAEYCIALTMLQFDGVESVVIRLDGKALPGAGGHPLREEDLILEGEISDPILYRSQLYFPLADGSALSLEYREYEVADTTLTNLASGVLRQLQTGPNTAQAVAIFAGNGKLTVEGIVDGVCRVELSQEALDELYASGVEPQLCIDCIVNSLAELDGIEAAHFSVDGQDIEGWAEIYQPRYTE